MNRREAIRLIGLSGACVAGGAGLSARQGVREASFFLLTDDPDRDLELLRLAAGLTSRRLHVDLWPVAPSPQDLTLIRSGGVVDPVRGSGVNDRLRKLALQLRSRNEETTFLLSISDADRTRSDDVIIARDGVVWDRLKPDSRYERIEIPVAQGIAVLRVRDGRLSVVEAPCRHKLCRKLSAGGAAEIICAPNRLIASVGRAGRLDGISG